MKEQKIPTPNFDAINPAICINAKIKRLHRLLGAVYDAQYRPFGLKGSMVSILFIAGKRKRINQKTLAALLILDPSTMSRDLKRLTEKGWIQIEKGEDARQSEVILTKAGYELLEKISPVWQQTHDKVQSILGTYSVHQLDVITNAIRENFTVGKE